MAIASILIGIFTGIVSFGAALVAGHGFVLALGFYILGGMIGVLVALALMVLRPQALRQGQQSGSMVAVRG